MDSDKTTSDSEEALDMLPDVLKAPLYASPLLDDLTYNLSLSDYPSLTGGDDDDEVDTNLFTDCPKIEQMSQDSIDLKSAPPSPTVANFAHSQTEIPDSEGSLKLEYECEADEIIEHNFADEYFEDDDEDEALKKQPTCMQVEIYSTPERDHYPLRREASAESLGVIVFKREKSLTPESSETNANSKGELAPELMVHEENSQLSNIMSDHNYTSQELQNSDTLRNNLLNHIINKSNSRTGQPNAYSASTANGELSEFVESILEKVNTFNLDMIKGEIQSDHDMELTDDDRDLFLQNVMDAVVAEDAAEEDVVDLLSSKSTQSKSIETKESGTETVTEIYEKSEMVENLETFEKCKDTEKTEGSKKIENTEIVEVVKKVEDIANIEDIANMDDIAGIEDIETLKECREIAADGKSSPKPSPPSPIPPLDDLESHRNEECDREGAPYLPENCSEPMEHTPFDETFELLAKVEQTKPNLKELPILSELTAFAKTLYDDCTSFASASTNIEEKLQIYIKEQLEAFKALAKIEKIELVDKSLQTEKKISKRNLRKLNSKNKKVLLQSSDSSASEEGSSSSSSSSSSEGEEGADARSQTTERESKKSSVMLPTKISPTGKIELDLGSENVNKKSSNSNQNYDPNYDDGVELTKYIQSEIFESEMFSNQSSMSSIRDLGGSSNNTATNDNNESESDNDNDMGMLNDEASSEKKADICSKVDDKISQSESDKENANSATGASISKQTNTLKSKSSNNMDEEDENDKEIERLINLNALAKRQTNVGSLKSGETEKSKAKSQIQKSKNEIIEFTETDLQKEVDSDESISESEEEIITETQYLARYNENLKQQLLNDSSSNSEDGDHGDDELVETLSDEDSNDSPPLIDKFLKNFKVEESDNEEDNDDSSEQTHHEEATVTNDEEQSVVDKHDKSKEPIAAAKSVDENSPSNSDCELLNDNLLFRKRTRPKSLEKMLTEADKRKKINKIDEDLISLSSESDASDVEAVDVEPTDAKSRILKPMLRQDQLASETRKAQKHENDRIRRLEKKHSTLAKTLKDHPEANKSGELVLDYIDETKTFIKVHPGIVKNLKPHQIEGVKFMYDSCYGGIEALKKSSGSGCILAHCMGLGKTLQLIALLHTVISYKELKTSKILVLCPKSTVMNWADEILRWLSPIKAKNVKVSTFNDTSDINEKLTVLREWSQSTQGKAGCLLIGYEAFRTLVFYHSYKNRGNVSSARLEDIRDKVDRYLLQPGADLVVCDEGHIIKNSKSAISMAVSKIVTPKRIILTGTPIQNNLKEYYSMVNFIKPLFLGTEKEFANLYANPIKNGQHKDSNKRDIKVMKQRSFVLHKKLSKFVQRKEAELLKSFLPQKFEYVLFSPMTTPQNNLYEYILEAISRREDNRGRSLITDYTCLRKIWTHPKVLEDAWKNATNQKFKKDARKNLITHSDDDQPDDIYDSQTGVMSVTNDWWRHLLTQTDLESILPSNKLRTMFEILRMCEEKGEKCLIFSAFVAVLNVVEYFFKKIGESDPATLQTLNISPNNKAKNSWIAGTDYFRLDGKTPKSIRHEMIKRFNTTVNNKARVFLISAKAGGQGINLIGANRVIILDTSWNPSNDQQNIFRIFRLGQKKNCYIYRLLAMGTMEEKVYSRSVTKQAMSFRVVDEQQIDRHYSMAELAELYTLTIPNYSDRPMPVFPQDSILASLLLNFPDLVYKYHEHDSLLENKVEQELSEQDKADAWAAYEKDLQLNSEIRELPNLEDLQNSFPSSKMPNYMNAFPGFDSLMNYGGLGQQAPFVQSLLSQYNYPASNQQYLDVLNLYRKYTQSAMSYPDMNPSIGDNSFNTQAAAAASYAAMNASKSIPTSSAAMLSALHGSSPSINSNPLSALGDLSMYGLGAPKNLSHGSNQAPTLPPQHSSMYSSPAPSTSANMQHAMSSFEQYKQQLESNFPSLYHYPNDYSMPSATKSKLYNNSHLNPHINTSQYTSPVPPPPPIGNKPAEQKSYLNAPAKPIEQQKQQQQQPQKLQQQLLQKQPQLQQHLQQQQPQRPQQQQPQKPQQQQQQQPQKPQQQQSQKPQQQQHQQPQKPQQQPPKPQQQQSQKPQQKPQQQQPQQQQKPQHHQQPDKQMFNKNLSSETIPHSVIRKAVDTSTKPTPNSPFNSAKVVPEPPKSAATSNLIQKRSTQIQQPSSVSSPKPSPSPATSTLSKLSQKPSTSSAAVVSAAAKAYDANRVLNMGIVYPSTNSPASASADLLKSNSEMQIIPTTSPPGTISISKQFNEISPSISLTAVRNSNVKTINVANKNQTQNFILSNSKTAAGNNISGSNGTMRSNTPTKALPIINKKPASNIKQITTPAAASSTPTPITLSSASAMAKQAAAAAVAAKSSAAIQNHYPNQHQKNAAPAASSTLAVKRNVHSVHPTKLIPATAVNQLQSRGGGVGGRTSTPPAIATSVNTFYPAGVGTATSSSNAAKQNTGRIQAVAKANASADKSRSSPITIAALRGQQQLQKRPLNSPTALPAVKNTLNIRPIESKQSPSGTGGVYIIETNNNEKRLAIGVPTKSGGGTTVTKVAALQRKRKAQEALSREGSGNESNKRPKESSVNKYNQRTV